MYVAAPLPTLLPALVDARQVQDWLGDLYPQSRGGEPEAEQLSDFCRRVAARAGAELVTLVRANKAGHTTAIAQSCESPLWVDLQNVPERWDQSFSGHGAVAIALRENLPVALAASDERLVVWHAALTAAGIERVLAVPLPPPVQRCVVAIYSRRN